MAGLKFRLQTAEISSGTAKQVVLQVIAPANQRVKVKEIAISFKGIVNTDAPILCAVERQSTAGSGGTSLTPVKVVTSDSETIQSTALKAINGSTMPTVTNTEMTEEVHPQGGFLWQAPYGEELIVAGGERLGIAVTAGVSVNCVARMVCEE